MLRKKLLHPQWQQCSGQKRPMLNDQRGDYTELRPIERFKNRESHMERGPEMNGETLEINEDSACVEKVGCSILHILESRQLGFGRV